MIASSLALICNRGRATLALMVQRLQREMRQREEEITSESDLRALYQACF